MKIYLINCFDLTFEEKYEKILNDKKIDIIKITTTCILPPPFYITTIPPENTNVKNFSSHNLTTIFCYK